MNLIFVIPYFCDSSLTPQSPCTVNRQQAQLYSSVIYTHAFPGTIREAGGLNPSIDYFDEEGRKVKHVMYIAYLDYVWWTPERHWHYLPTAAKCEQGTTDLVFHASGLLAGQSYALRAVLFERSNALAVSMRSFRVGAVSISDGVEDASPVTIQVLPLCSMLSCVEKKTCTAVLVMH